MLTLTINESNRGDYFTANHSRLPFQLRISTSRMNAN
jgi:hypothetical protein